MGESSYMDRFGGESKPKEIHLQKGYDIPPGYNDNKIVLMVRDPWTLYTYWEVNRGVEDSVKAEIARKGLTPSRSILRVYEIQEDPAFSQRIVYDFDLRDWANSWYVHTKDPGMKWKVQIGIICNNGEFFCLVESNIVQTPAYGMSGIYDDEWMCSEDQFYKLFGIAGGYGIGRSSMEMKEVLERHLKSWLSSGGITSGMFGSASFFLHQRQQENKKRDGALY